MPGLESRWATGDDNKIESEPKPEPKSKPQGLGASRWATVADDVSVNDTKLGRKVHKSNENEEDDVQVSKDTSSFASRLTPKKGPRGKIGSSPGPLHTPDNIELARNKPLSNEAASFASRLTFNKGSTDKSTGSTSSPGRSKDSTSTPRDININIDNSKNSGSHSPRNNDGKNKYRHGNRHDDGRSFESRLDRSEGSQSPQSRKVSEKEVLRMQKVTDSRERFRQKKLQAATEWDRREVNAASEEPLKDAVKDTEPERQVVFDDAKFQATLEENIKKMAKSTLNWVDDDSDDDDFLT